MSYGYHMKAAEFYRYAAKHHEEASMHYRNGNQEEGAYHAHTARKYEEEARNSLSEGQKLAYGLR